MIRRLRARHPWVLLAVAVAVLVSAWLPFRHAGRNGFVFDDRKMILTNPRVQGLGHLGAIFTTEYWDTPGYPTALYRPLPLASYALESAVFGSDPGHFHAVNVALHGVVSLFVALLIFLLLRGTGAAAGIAALAGGMLFALHPIHSDAVLPVVGRADLLCAAFSIAALCALVASGRWKWAAPVLMACALLSKESAILILLFVLVLSLLGRIPQERDEPAGRDARRSRRRAGRTVIAETARARVAQFFRVLLLLGPGIALAAVLRALALGSRLPAFGFSDNPLIAAGIGRRIATACSIFGRYAGLHLWPDPLLPDYSFNAVPVVSWNSLPAVAGVLGLLVATGAGLLLLRRSFEAERPVAALAAFGVLWWVLGLIAISNLFVSLPVIMAERFTYLPSAGLFIALGAGAAAVAGLLKPSSPGDPHQARGPALVLGVALSAVAVAAVALSIRQGQARTAAWNSNDALFRTAVRDCPRNEKLWTSLASVQLDEGRPEDALTSLRRARAIYPDAPKVYELLGLTWLRLGRRDSARVAAEEIRRHPSGRALGFFVLAEISREDGRFDESLAEAKSGLAFDGQFEPLHLSLVSTYEAAGRKGEAIEAALTALRALPPSSTLYAGIGPVLVEGERWDAAVRVYELLDRQDPTWSNDNYLAWSLLGRRRAGAGSVSDLNTALKLSAEAARLAPAEMRSYPLDTGAQIQWELGDRQAAVRTMEELLRELPPGADREEPQARLAQYRRSLPGSSDLPAAGSSDLPAR